MPALALVHGPDAQALDDALAAVTRALFPDLAMVALSREVYDGRETTADTIARAAETLPFGGATRLVAVRHCQGLPLKGNESLGEYLKRPSPATCLLLLADVLLTGERDRKPHWLLDAVPPGAVVTLAPLQGASLREWLRQRATAEGYTLTADAASLLVQWMGEDRVTLLAEVRKAALAGGPDNLAVGVREVSAVVGEHRVTGVFDLTRAVEHGDVAKALGTLEALLATEEPMAILFLLVRGLRQVRTAREGLSRGQAPDQVGRMLHVPPFAARAIVARAQATTDERLARDVERCWEVERRLKSSGEPRAELTALVAELCAGA